MISVETLERALWNQKMEWVTATNEQVEQLMRNKIEEVLAYNERSVVLSLNYWSPAYELFTIEGGKMSTVSIGEEDFRVEPKRVQEIGFQVMKQYGFDEGMRLKEKDCQQWVGERTEMITYGSRTHRDLVFRRFRSYTDDGTFSVEWNVGTKRSSLRIHPLEALGKRK